MSHSVATQDLKIVLNHSTKENLEWQSCFKWEEQSLAFSPVCSLLGRHIYWTTREQSNQWWNNTITECTIVTGGEATVIGIIWPWLVVGDPGWYSLPRSNVLVAFKGSCSMSKNQAVMGGGIYASSLIINVYQSSVLLITNNNASFGGGVYLEVDPKLNHDTKNNGSWYNITAIR